MSTLQPTDGTLDLSAFIGQVRFYDIVAIIIILAVAVIVAKIATILVKKRLSDRMDKNELKIFVSVIWWGIIFIGILIASPHFKVDLSGLLVAGGIIGIVIGFASQSVVSNFVSGVFLVLERPVKIGDNININDVSGVVERIRILSTIVRTFEGIYVRIPNEKVFTSNITNFVSNVARRFDLRIGIGYRDNVEDALRLIREVIEEEPFALKNPEPQVFVEKLGESAVELVIRVWAPSTEWYDLRMELLKKIKITLDREGIDIPYPQQVIWFKKPGSPPEGPGGGKETHVQ